MSLRQAFDFDPRLQLPRNILFCGTTQSGKTSLFLKTLEHALRVYNPKPDRVLFFYNCYQDSYMRIKGQLADKGIEIEFIQSSSFSEEEMKSLAGDGTKQTIMAVDDATMQTTASKELAHLFTVARHYNVSLVLFWHVIFAATPASRVIAQNVGYYFLLNSPKMQQQVAILGGQIGLRRALQSAYDAEMRKPYGYVLVDLATNVKHLRIRGDIMEEHQSVFVTRLTNQRQAPAIIAIQPCFFIIYVIRVSREWSVLMSAAESGFGGVLSSSAERFPISSTSTAAPSSRKRKQKQRKAVTKRTKKYTWHILYVID